MNFSFKNMKFENLKRYWYFPLSALAFLLLNGRASVAYFISIIISFSIIIIFTTCNEAFFSTVYKSGMILKIFSSMTAIGVSWNNSGVLYKRAMNSPNIQKLIERFNIDIFSVITYCAPLLAIFEFIFVYICVIWFWQWFMKVVKDLALFDNLERKEIVFYFGLFFVACMLITSVYIKAYVFYIGIDSIKEIWSVVYTTDSPMNYCSFLTLTWGDFRHPLFALFAAPFMGLSYFIAKIFNLSSPFQALIMQYFQIIMLFITTYIITKIMDLTAYKRIIFFLISYCSYTYLLFTLTMEHYIVYLFWLSLLIYAICKKTKMASDIFWGAVGTIITNGFFIVFLSENSPLKRFKSWLKDIINIIQKFFLLLISFGYADMFYNLWSQIIFISIFTGKNILFADKFRQYTFFPYECFFAPNAGIKISQTSAGNQITWQLQSVDSVSYIGIIIFILCMISAFINWNKKSSRFAFLWIIFSFFVLCLVGWGTAENGLILYSLYFGWAFFVLMFQLVEKIEEKLNVKFLLPLYLAVNIYILFAI